MPKPIGGTAYIKVDGQQFAVKGSLIVKCGDIEREGIAGQDGVHGFLENHIVPEITLTISDGLDVLLEDLQLIEDATVTAELINEKSYVLRNAWLQNRPELNSQDGEMDLVFQGMSCNEII